MSNVKLPLVVAAALAMVLGAGCVDDDVSFYIQQNQVVEEGCTVSTTEDVFLSAGVLDVSLGYGYYMNPLVVNNMRETAQEDKQPERNNLHMKRFDVTIDMSGAPVSAPTSELDFSVPRSGTIQAGGVAYFARVKVISDKLAGLFKSALQGKPNLQPIVQVSMRAIAERSNEVRESAEFVYPISLCSGCLVDLRTAKPDANDKTVEDSICGWPQDMPVTCYTVNGNTYCIKAAD